MSGEDEELSEETVDAITTALMRRVAERGHYQGVMGELAPAERVEVEAAMERHAARRRALGEPGW